MTMKFLIDECLHTSLVQVAHAAGYAADHVNFLSLGGLKDWQLLPVIRERDFTFVTNNGPDFLALRGKDCTQASSLSSPMSRPFFSESSSRPPSTTLGHGI